MERGGEEEKEKVGRSRRGKMRRKGKRRGEKKERRGAEWSQEKSYYTEQTSPAHCLQPDLTSLWVGESYPPHLNI